MLRKNLRFEDLLDLETLPKKINGILDAVNAELTAYGAQPISYDELWDKCMEWKERYGDMIVEPISFLHNYMDEGKNILFEGQLAAMKDIDLGIYPYVTSSNPVAAYAAVSSGFPAKKIDRVIGVAKAFSSAVGAGPFPTESDDEQIQIIRGTGEHVDDEFGARTGRSRRLGWFDAPVVKYTNLINGFDELALCKIDKLDDLPEIKICVGYKLDGELLDHYPNTDQLERVEPVYKVMPGWMEDTTGIRKIEDLPENAKNYIKTIEDLTDTKICYVGVGPGRTELAL